MRVDPSVNPGAYNLRVRATSGSLVREAALSLTVAPPPSFDLSLGPSSLNLRVGETATLTATLTPRGGFQGVVLLSVRAPGFARVSPAEAAVNLADGPRTATFQVEGSAEGTGTLEVRAESGSLARTATLPLAVRPYAIEASATPATGHVPHVPPTTTLTLTGRGYAGLVQVAASGGYAVSPGVVEARDGSPQTYTLTLTPPERAPFGSQEVTLTLTTTAGGPRATVRVPVTLQGIALRILEVIAPRCTQPLPGGASRWTASEATAGTPAPGELQPERSAKVLACVPAGALFS